MSEYNLPQPTLHGEAVAKVSRGIAAGIAKSGIADAWPAEERRASSADESEHEKLSSWPQPEPLGTALPSVPIFAPELLPEAIRPLAEDVADRMQVPLDFPAIAAVAILAGATNRRALVQPKRNDSSWVVTPNLWGAIVADPGMLKSPVLACMTKPMREIEVAWREQHKDALIEFAADQERAKLAHSAWQDSYKSALKKNTALPDRPDDSVEPPTEKRLLTSDATFESLHQVLSENPAGLFVLRDELTGWLAGLERQGREQERSFYLESWNGDSSFTLDRIGRGSVHVPHACISLFGGIQPARLRSYLADALRDGPGNDGLIQRFQLLVWPDTQREWRYVDQCPNQRAITTATAVYTRIVALDAENPLLLQFAESAQQMFVAWLSDLEGRIRRDDVSPPMQAHLSKYRSLMPSLALLFSLADGELRSVGLRHAQQAAAMCDYLELHARRVYASRISPERLAAISLGQRIRSGWKHVAGCFTIRDVYQNDWSGLGGPEQVRAAMEVLESAGWVQRLELEHAKGRPSESYLINPKIGGDHGDN